MTRITHAGPCSPHPWHPCYPWLIFSAAFPRRPRRRGSFVMGKKRLGEVRRRVPHRHRRLDTAAARARGGPAPAGDYNGNGKAGAGRGSSGPPGLTRAGLERADPCSGGACVLRRRGADRRGHGARRPGATPAARGRSGARRRGASGVVASSAVLDSRAASRPAAVAVSRGAERRRHTHGRLGLVSRRHATGASPPGAKARVGGPRAAPAGTARDEPSAGTSKDDADERVRELVARASRPGLSLTNARGTPEPRGAFRFAHRLEKRVCASA